MKLASIAALGLLALQNVGFDRADAVGATPARFQYARPVRLAEGTQPGQACAILDAATYARTRGRMANLRLYASSPTNTAATEVPFVITESGELDEQEEPARILALAQHDGRLSFDLAMPARAYTAVDLDLNAHDFIAAAEVSAIPSPQASGSPESRRIPLGTFTLFDLSSEHLPHATSIRLQEETFPLLHVKLRFFTPAGKPLTPPASVLTGATVPPSRSAQTLYSTVAATTAFTQRDGNTEATFTLPSGVPVERVAFTLDPSWKADFLRTVSVQATAKANGHEPAHHEVANGTIYRVHRPSIAPGIPPIDAQQLALESILGANLQKSATVVASVANSSDVTSPIRSVALQMRERKLCFEADPTQNYQLLYGSPTPIRPAAYDYARAFRPSVAATLATLGPEIPNPQFHPEEPHRHYTAGHPEILWVVLLLIVAALGMLALRTAKRGGHR